MSTSAVPIYLYYKLRLRSPAIVSTLSGDPNSAATQPFIPGSAIRGALAARLLANGISGDSDEFRRLILSGEVRYLHAYPEVGGERALPRPSSWRSQKADQTSVIDLASFSGVVDAGGEAEDFGRIWPEEGLVSIPAPFTAASVSAGARSSAAPPIGSRLHQQRDRVKGRPWKDRAEQPHGALFAYEYLEADQVFRGVIQIMPAAAADIECIRGLFGVEPILVGRSRRAGYGGEAEVEFTGQAQREYENASGSISRDIAAGTFFRAMLASAYVGRHPATGQIDPSALQQELRRRLSAAATVERTRWAFETVGAFNQKWRLEVPQAQAVAAGAVLVLESTAAIPVANLREIEHEGLGERRVEGFGRVLFLEHSADHGTIRLDRTQGQDHGKKPVQAGSRSREQAEQHRRQLEFVEQRIVLAAARKELDQIAVADVARRAKGKIPTNSLLGRIRTLFRGIVDEATAEAALGRLATWSGDGDNALKDKARKQLEKSQVLGGNLMTWLKELATARAGERGWKTLTNAVKGSSDRLNSLAQNHHLTDKDAAQAHLNAHAAELCVYLVDGVLVALARKNRRKREKADE